MTVVEQIWRDKTDGELSEAADNLSEYTEEAARVIRAELQRRGLNEPVTDADALPIHHEDTRCVFVANGQDEANQIVAFLQAAGIASALRGESTTKTHGFTSMDWADWRFWSRNPMKNRRVPFSRPQPRANSSWVKMRTSSHEAGEYSRARGGNMKSVANSRFTIKTWDEKPYSEGQDLPKMTRAAVTKTFTGDIAGEGHVEYLMMYRSDGSASFVGLERVVGRVAGKAGSFVLQRTGVFEDGVAKESYSVIPGSGTGELRSLRGEGTSAVGHGSEHPLTLNYELG